MTKKTEKRIKFPEMVNTILDEYCEVFGSTPVAAISPLIIHYLSKELHRARRRGIYSVNTYISNVSTPSTKTPQSIHSEEKEKPAKKPRRKLTALPKDFSPPREIADNSLVNYEMALDAFKDWALGGGHTKADWIATFRTACRSWLPERFPQMKTKPKDKFL